MKVKMTESEEYFEILKIIDERHTIDRGKKIVEYLVLWKGYNPEEAGLKFNIFKFTIFFLWRSLGKMNISIKDGVLHEC